MSITKKKRAIYAASLICKDAKNDAFYNIQVIEIDRATDKWQIEAQYGDIGSTENCETDKRVLNLSAATKKMHEIVAAKMAGGGEREYRPAAKIATPTEIKMLTAAEIEAVTGKVTKRDHNSTINREDPELVRLMEDERVVAILVEDPQTKALFEHRDGKVHLNGLALPGDNPIAKSAMRLGADFKVEGYLSDNVFTIVDDLSEQSREKTYEQRLAAIDDLLLMPVRAVKGHKVHYGDEKNAALEQAINGNLSIKFISLDANQDNEVEHFYPR